MKNPGSTKDHLARFRGRIWLAAALAGPAAACTASAGPVGEPIAAVNERFGLQASRVVYVSLDAAPGGATVAALAPEGAE
ncbi:MAG: hypothetical protein ACYTE6_11290, partial [Planctomycetota bacterium]